MSSGLKFSVHNFVSVSHLDCDTVATPFSKHVPRKGDRGANVLSLWKYRSLFLALGARSVVKYEACGGGGLKKQGNGELNGELADLCCYNGTRFFHRRIF
jgi:hypothetical protein